MSNQELVEQFKKCEEWHDAEQWDALGMLYFNRGYMLNAGVCFKRADACKANPELVLHVVVETVPT
jgi:hypothetical protein